MSNYDELVKALSSASTISTAWEKLMHDAAAAIEELLAFAHYVADKVTRSDEDWEDYHEAFAEVACRKLVKLGIVSVEDDKYVYSAEVQDEVFENDPFEPTYVPFDALGKIVDWFVKLVDDAPTIPAPRWVRCEDELPKEKGWYLVYAPTYRGGSSSGKESAGSVMFSKWSGKTWSIEVGYYERPNCVTHWMPIEPPKEGE